MRFRSNNLSCASALLALWICLAMAISSDANAQDTNSTSKSEPERIEAKNVTKLISIRFKDADLKEVLVGLGEIYGVNIVVPPEVQGKITINLSNISLEEGLGYILTSTGHVYKKLDNAYIIQRYELPQSELLEIFTVEVKDDKLTIDAIDVEIGPLIAEIAQKSGRNIVTSSSVQGKVTVRIIEVPLEEGLKIILATNGFTCEKFGNILSVDKPAMRQGQQRFRLGALSTAASLMATPIEVKDGLVTINVDDIELMELLRVLAEKAEVNIITFGNINDRVSIHISSVPFELALKLILSGTQYSYKRVKLDDLESQNFVGKKLGTEQADEKQDVYVIGDAVQTGALYPFFASTEVFNLSYLKAEEANTFLSNVIPQTSVKVLKAQNALAITGTSDMLEKAKTEIAQIDIPPKIIMIEALIVELFDGSVKDLGIDFSASTEYFRGETPGSIIYQSIGGLPKAFSASLRTLVENGKAHIHATPRLAAISGEQANIDITQERYYRVGTTQSSQQGGQQGYYPYYDLRTIKAGVSLTITSWAGANGNITVNIAPEVSSMSTTGPEALPEVSSRKASTTIQVKDGETIVIGGLKQTEESRSVKKTPVLGSIPLLGRLFQSIKTNSRETELTIFITPHILPIEESHEND